ncbi:MAG: hypothetical protein WEA84_14460 [Rhodovibrionaceae bacterium]
MTLNLEDPVTALTEEIRITSLTSSEALLLSIYRQWLRGLECQDSRYWERAWREAARALGGNAGRAALSSLECLLRRIAAHALRRVSYHPPCCGYLADDERLLLGAVAGAGSAQGDLLLTKLVRAEGLGEVREAAATLAEAFAEGGCGLRTAASGAQPWQGVDLHELAPASSRLH